MISGETESNCPDSATLRQLLAEILPDDVRLGPKLLPMFYAPLLAALLVALLGYIATNFLALGYVLDAVFGTGLGAAIWIGAIVVLAYTVAGGILAGVYADVFQGVVMAAASVAACWYAMRAGGGLGGISTTIMAADPAFLGPWGKGGAMTALSFFFVFGVGSLAQPHIAHKYLMARDPGQFRWYPMVMTVAMTLAFYDVPDGAPGLKR